MKKLLSVFLLLPFFLFSQEKDRRLSGMYGYSFKANCYSFCHTLFCNGYILVISFSFNWTFLCLRLQFKKKEKEINHRL